ncbi:c-type cytochrome [Roseivivax sp. CAU 1761]
MADKNRQSLMTARNVGYAGLGALVLSLFGTLLYRAEVLSRVLGIYEGPSAIAAAETGAGEARRNFEADREDLAVRTNGLEMPRIPVGPDGYFAPPDPADIPDGPFGEAVRRGREIFLNPATNAAEFVGNDLACANCHLDAGRKPNAAPMWAAAVLYPKHRGKNDKINDMEMRINGCFTYSMNAPNSPSGGPPPWGHQVYSDLQSYFFWLSTGAPNGVVLPGQSYPTPDEPEDGYDRDRGRVVFEENCSICHGDNGEGRKDRNGRYVFPPLWGPGAYNWGAGMHRVNTAAGFIYANMPLGKPFSLTAQEAWDVAAWINSQKRPPDPRQKGKMSVAEAKAEFHADDPDYYGVEIDGWLLGTGVDRDPRGQAGATGIVVPEPAKAVPEAEEK